MGITLDGRRLEEFGMVFLEEHENPAASSTRDMFSTLPGIHGAHDYGAELEPKPFSLPIGIKEQSSQMDIRNKIQDFVQVILGPDGRPRNFILQYDYIPDKYYTARYSGSLPIQKLINMGRFRLPLTAFDPAAYHTTSTEEITMGSDTSVLSEVLLGSKYTFDITAPQTIQVHNFSYYNIRPTIEISGSFDSLTITCNGKSFSLGAYTNTHIDVIGKDYTVLVNGQGSFSAMTGKHIEFISGYNDVQIDGSGLDITITFKFKPKYFL